MAVRIDAAGSVPRVWLRIGGTTGEETRRGEAAAQLLGGRTDEARRGGWNREAVAAMQWCADKGRGEARQGKEGERRPPAMDPLIKLLDDDVDETMHSGADVEAFTAALNREVEGSGGASTSAAASSSQPLDHGAGLVPQESNSMFTHNHEQWQGSVKNEIGNQENQQQEQKHLHHSNEQPSRPELVSGGADNKQDQPKKNEVSKEHFLKVVRTIVGDKLLKQAAAQYQAQAAHGQRNPQTNPSNYSLLSQVSNQQNVPSGSTSGVEHKSYPSAHSIPANQASDSPRPPFFRPSLSGQMQSNMGYPSSESNLQKVNESSNMSDVKGGHMLSHPHNIQSAPGQATQHPQTSLPVLGSNNIHARPLPRPVGGPIVPLRPQMADSSQRGQLVQGAVTSVTGSMAARPTLQTNISPWQQVNKEQKTKSFPPTEHTNKIQPATQTPPPAAASKTPQKKASAGQKKPLDALGSSPPPSSKKQKTSGGYHDQSIDQLNDVTAVSGVNLREEEEQLFSAPKEESRVSEAARMVVQLEEEKLILQKVRKCNLKSIGSDVERCLSMRVDLEKSRHRIYPLSSDVRSHILRVNREAREQWDKKLAEDAERIRKQSDGDDNAVVDSEKDKNESRSTSKHAKTYKAEDDKTRTTAANAAARVAAGGDDMLSRWQFMAEKKKSKCDGDGSSGSMPGNMLPRTSSPKPGKGSREQQEIEKTGGVRRSSHVKVTRSITVKDVIAALEREPQMLKSSLLFQLYGRSPAESSAK
uniref:RST domain-containing protein n=1 Tax=Oryza sativa subsp. japonica TaxID=39947 RepID=Q851U2_ORYSJ|nr:unknown protein [Oryza sativa Japonica Group]